jgi:chromosome partitioning protein
MDSASYPRASVVTVLNLKGGVGKTHTVWLLASVCHERSQRILVLDTDTQANFTKSFLPRRDGHLGVEALFHPAAEADPRSLICRTAYPHIDVIPAGPALARYDLSDQTTWEKADLHLSLVDVLNELCPQYDLIVLDCPPRLSLVSFAALCASDGVVIPMEAADWGAQGIVQVTAAIDYVRGRFNRRLTLLGYLVSRFKRVRSYQRSYLERLRAHFGDLAFDTVIPDLAEFEKSVTDRIPVTLHAPRSEEAAIARRLFDEVGQRLEKLGRGSPRGSRPSLHRPDVATA